MLETLKEIDFIHLNFSDDNKFFLNLTIAFIMFGVALELKPIDFRRLISSPKAAIIGIISQSIVLPLLTLLFLYILGDNITPTVGLGMILVAACPGGNVSNFICSLARGNVALSVSLTAFNTIACILLTPFNFSFWGGIYLRTMSADMKGALLRPLEIDSFSMLSTIVIILGAPLIIGMLFRFKFPSLTNKILVPIKRFSILAFSAMVIIIFTLNFEHFLNYISIIFVLVLVHNVLAMGGGYLTAKWSGLVLQDRKTVAIETGIQNSGLALALLFNPAIFPPEVPVGGMVFIAAWWGVWHIIAGLTIAGYWSGFKLGSSALA